MRLLITDVLYPNRYSTWRNVMLEYLIEHTGADVMVFKAKKFALNSFDFDFCNRNGILDGYNVKHFSKSKYLLSRNKSVEYDAVYHLFASCFFKFQSDFPKFSPDRQVVHLYPNSGYNFLRLEFPAGTNIISTHPKTTEIYQDYKMIECLFSVQVKSSDDIVSRDFSNKPEITVCFSSLGISLDKGDKTYLDVVNRYIELFPEDRVRFVSVGNCTQHHGVEHYDAMDYVSLGEFYKNNVDIYLSAETGFKVNGWPIGLEAGVTGSVILTTDSRNTAASLNLPDPSILTCHNTEEFVYSIRKIYLDRGYANLCSQNTRSFLLNHLSPRNQQDRILEFITEASKQ